MTKRITLVTGGAGAIGFQLAKFLSDQGREIYIADNFIRSERNVEFQELTSKKMFMKYKLTSAISHNMVCCQMMRNTSII